MVERIEVDIFANTERHSVSLEQGIFSIDGNPYRQLDRAPSLLLATCMLKPGVPVDWTDISDSTRVTKRQIGFDMANQLRLDHTVRFRSPGQSDQSFLSAIYPKKPKKKVDGSISVRALRGLRFNNRIDKNSTIYDVVKLNSESEVYSAEPESSGTGQGQEITPKTVIPRNMESISTGGSELIKFMKPREVYSLDRILAALRTFRNYSKDVNIDEVRAELAVLVRNHNDDKESAYKVKMVVIDDQPSFILVRRSFTAVSTEDVSVSSQLNSLN